MLSSAPSILIVEDERGMQRLLQLTFENVGYAATAVPTGKEALRQLGLQDYSVIILDLGLPDIDGIDLIGRIRALASTPIIVLSGRGGEAARVAALDAGANDFVGKPFSQLEFLARVRVMLRPPPDPTRQNLFRIGEVRIDFRRHKAVVGTRELRLSARESRFLRILAQNIGTPVSHREIIEAVWGAPGAVEAQNVRVLAAQVRSKLSAGPGAVDLIQTQPGFGYRLVRQVHDETGVRPEPLQ